MKPVPIICIYKFECYVYQIFTMSKTISQIKVRVWLGVEQYKA
jgi:hypothetical protein